MSGIIGATVAALGLGAGSGVGAIGAGALLGGATPLVPGIAAGLAAEGFTAAAAGTSFFSGVGSFLGSNAFAIGTAAMGLAGQVGAANYQAALARQQVDIRNAFLAQNLALGEQKKEELLERFVVDREQRGIATRAAQGRVKVAAAGLGQALEPESPGEIAVGDIGAEHAFQEAFAFYNLQGQRREIDIAAATGRFDIGLNALTAEAARTAANFNKLTATTNFLGTVGTRFVGRERFAPSGNRAFA
jgi:hypothetical protein